MKNNARAFVNQFFIGLLVTLCFGGSVGLGTVWIRHQISITANTNRVLVADIAELDRHLAEKSALVETEQRPDNLRRRNLEFRLGLVPMSDSQVAVVPVADDPVRQMAMKANLRLFGEFPDQAAPILWRDPASRQGRMDTPGRVTFSVLGR